jgi:hypothetical protein
MKQLTIAFILLCFYPTGLTAQSFSLSPEIGFISSFEKLDYLPEISRRNTYFSAITAKYQLNDKTSISSGVNYLRQGLKSTFHDLGSIALNQHIILKLDYIMIPFVGNFQLFNSIDLYGTLGLYTAFNIRAINDRQNFPEPDDVYVLPRNIREGYVQKIQYGGIIGIGYNFFETERVQLDITAKYYQGLRETFPIGLTAIDHLYTTVSNSLLLTLVMNYSL